MNDTHSNLTSANNKLHIDLSNKSTQPVQNSTMATQNLNFIQQILSPGGGMLLIPFTRAVILCLLLTTLTVLFMGIARIHMFILSVLSAGMWFALGLFEREFSKAMNREIDSGSSNSSSAGGVREDEKMRIVHQKSKRASPAGVSAAKRED